MRGRLVLCCLIMSLVRHSAQRLKIIRWANKLEKEHMLKLKRVFIRRMVKWWLLNNMIGTNFLICKGRSKL